MKVDPKEIEVRNATIRDLDSVAEIYNQGIDNGFSTFDSFHVSADLYKQYLDKKETHSFLLVADYRKEVIGWTSIDPMSQRHAYRFTCKGSTYMRKEFCGNNYARILMQEKFRRARELGYHSLVVEVLSINQHSIKFLFKLGYHIIGEIREAGYRNGNWIGMTMMQKLL